MKLTRKQYTLLGVCCFLLVGGVILLDALKFGVPAMTTLTSLGIAAIGWFVQIKPKP